MKRIRISHLEPIKDLYEGDQEKMAKAINYVLEGKTDPPWWHICITSGSGFPIVTPERMREIGCLGVLPVAFDDLIPNRKYWGSNPHEWPDEIKFTYRMPHKSHADAIIRLLDRVKSTERLVVNCEAGISRSAAVAYFAAQYMGLNPDEEFKRDQYSPNPLVGALLREATGFVPLDESWELLRDNPRKKDPWKDETK